ncbi:hypothetical protein [Planctomycetes bacterium K23_9]|uniref:Outer membrane efflux protein n=1 Tax=Stieleria marina TaxID=1930275 RepID=A0A517NVT5_9BACT|nr:hypothetical protein K239x_32340 [Planctomycetes bacterium K23_9]
MKKRRLTIGIAATVLMVSAEGCSRHYFRKDADQEVDCVIAEKGGHLDHGSIYARADSRMADPNAVDCPPMPPDDARSHRLMVCVDGKKGYPHWNQNGRLGSVEPALWMQSLPGADEGKIKLDLRDAMQVARLHSRQYQNNLETLYLSALDVTFERFRFDHQFFAGSDFGQDFRGRDAGQLSQSALNSGVGFNKLTATGGEMVVGLANSLVWDSWGSGSDALTSTLNFSLVQPLLRLGGRARVLEQLTQTERNLLANVRQMQQFRQGFYVDIITGRNSGSGPSLANNVGQNGLGVIAGFPSGRNGAASASGYLGLLQDQQQIRNQDANIAALRDSLAQLEAQFAANRIANRLQVDQARQALLNAQSSQLASKAAYESRVDDFKIELGLPPDLPLEIADSLLDRFVLIHPDLSAMQNELADILLEARQGAEEPTQELIDRTKSRIGELSERLEERIAAADADLEKLDDKLPGRRKAIALVGARIRSTGADVDPRVYDEKGLMKRIDFLSMRLPQIKADIAKTAELSQSLGKSSDQVAEKEDSKNKSEDGKDGGLSESIDSTIDLAATLSDLLLELSLVHAEIRLQGISLPPVSITAPEAVDVARLNRLDWMNARANLVDSWRKIEFFANDLKSNLDVVVDGQIGTPAGRVTDFETDNSRLRLGIEFDSPTARLAERNRYRESLIDYQRSRRDYMLFEDRVTQSLRNTLRIIELSQINLEVRRTAVQVAISQVDLARLRLNPPVRVGQQAKASPTSARDLVSALTDLLDAQNDLLNVWVSYEVLRVLLDFEMGTMELDPTGVWIDTGEVQAENTPGLPNGEAYGDGLPVDPAGPLGINSPLKLADPNTLDELGMIDEDR